MTDRKLTFNQQSEISFNEEHWQKINFNMGCFERNFAKGKINYRNMDLEKQRVHILRNKSLDNLEKLLVDFETHFTDNGGNVLWARDADDACNMIFDIMKKERATVVSRSNSMTLDEIDLNGFLKRKNLDLVETSVARFVLQLAEMKPYHPLAPAVNLSKEEINEILTHGFKLKPDSTPKQMVNFVRHKVSNDLKEVKVCVTGANFIISEEGCVVFSENEGNILRSTSTAKVHIVVAGIAKVIPSIDDLGILLPLLSSHATGQSMAAFNTITFGPAQEGDGPEKMYVILLNNGRSEVLSHEKQRQVLSCIHCSACVSVCPIFKNVGGYTYDTTHVGPMGAVMTPLKESLSEFGHLATACSLCGKCTEICPVKIPLDDLIIENRHLLETEKIADTRFDTMIKTMIWHCKSRKKMDSPLWMKKLELKRFMGPSWGERRVMPEFAPKSFSQYWRETRQN